VGVGGLAIAAGVAWLFADGDDDPAPAAAATTTSESTTTGPTASTTTTAPTTTSTEATTTTTTPVETPQEFFDLFTEAQRTGDIAFLVARLHPAVLDRYDTAACETYLGSIDAPNPSAEVQSVGATATWSWETDGLARDIPDATTVTVRRTEDGTSFVEGESHIVTGDDGRTRWFTDCGSPKEGAR
jgi:hypothetical protein